MFPPCNAISEGRLPLCSTSSEAGALTSEVRIENDSDRKFSKSICFKHFLGTTFIHVLWYAVQCSLLAENIFSVFRSPHSAPTHRYTILDSRLLPCNYWSKSFSIRTSEGRAPASELVSQRGSLPSEIATAGLFD